jgi:hypothetical protein
MFQAFKDLNRLREIAVLAVRHGFGEMLDRSRLWEILGLPTECIQELSQLQDFIRGEKIRGIFLAQHDRRLLAERILQTALHQTVRA